MSRQRRKPLPKGPQPVGPLDVSLLYALRVPCPTCEEPDGQRCTYEGQPTVGLHVERLHAANPRRRR